MIYDCSIALTPSIVTWPGEQPLKREVTATIEKDGVEVSRLTFGSHTGTHIDAPRHFVAGGNGIHQIPLEALVGAAYVIDLTHIDFPDGQPKEITPEHITHIDLSNIQRILFKTENSTRQLLDIQEFTSDYVSLSVETAKLLVQHHILLVGVDYLSVEKKSNPDHPVHTALLRANIVNIEGVRLTDVPAGTYHLTALPINIVDGDGAPTRVLLQTYDQK